MLSKQVYAVVDIEATGGSVGANERIIQIAIVLIQNNETIHTFESLVNPGKNIPKGIRKLTGISNKDVNKAPYFEEIAPMLLTLLQDTIFVAHNVGFDFRFLNEQFKAHGFKQLSNPAFDTVELTQILHPTLDSFQLENIASYLNYNLSDAHDALADAKATAHIFLRLLEYAKTLPLVTLEKLFELAGCTTHETKLFFKQVLMLAKSNVQPLADDLVVVNQIAIKKPIELSATSRDALHQTDYPKTKEEKLQYFNGDYTYRETQTHMMDAINDYLKSPLSIKKLAVEAPPGIGKTMGYMFPVSFLTEKDFPIVISTYSTVLQTQLIEETVPALERIIDRELFTILVKGRQHYLSLSIFERWLKLIKAKDSEAYLSMRILVWLTQTVTGDLSEINAGSHLDLTFWQEIRVSNNQPIDQHWKAYDFFERIKESLENAEVIVTNHSFLIHDWHAKESIIPSLDYLIIDEAHHFPEIVSQTSTHSIHGIELFSQLEKIGTLNEDAGILQLINQLEKENSIEAIDLLKLARTTELIKESWESILESFLFYYEDGAFKAQRDSQFVEKELKLEDFSFKQKRVLKNINRGLEEFIYVSQNILAKALEHFDNRASTEQLKLIELGKIITFMINWKQKFQLIFALDKEKSRAIRWVSYLPEHIENSFQLKGLQWGEENSLIDYLAKNSKVIFTSSTLSYKDSEQYFSDQLKNLPLNFIQLSSPYDYGKQVRVMLPEKNINPTKYRKDEYSKALARELATILKHTSANTIVLFRSITVLREVYQLLNDIDELSPYTILAQSISGTRNRILKNFKRHKPAIILGADSFFEGIDLPEDELDLVILTRLPFPAPDTPIMQLKSDYLKRNQLNPFIHEYLPQAVLKFKQAFGRLIRNEVDKGVLVLLDDRFLSANYSKVFTESLPNGVPIELYKNEELGEAIQKFISSNPS